MAKRRSRIEIAADVIDIDDEIVAIDAISRCAIGRDPARIRTANSLFLLALFAFGAAGFGFLTQRMEPMAIGGAIGLIALVRGLILIRRKSLFLITSDSRASVLLQDDEDFMRDVLKLIRASVVGETDAGTIYEIDPRSQQIVRRTSNAQQASAAGVAFTEDASGPDLGLGRTRQGGDGHGAPASQGLNGATGATVDHGVGRTLNGAMSDRGAGLNGSSGQPTAGLDLGGAHPTTATTQPHGTAAQTGAVGPLDIDDDLDDRPGLGVRTPPNLISHDPAGQGEAIEPARAIQSFDVLLGRIAPQYGERFGDVELWLAPVRDHLATGTGNRAEAQARWSIFAKEHLPALISISGVPSNARMISQAIGLSHPV